MRLREAHASAREARCEACSGACSDTQLDSLNCGECGNTCAEGELCFEGKCQERCQDPTAPDVCGGLCVDFAHDENNCGSRNNFCDPIANASVVCSNGQCLQSSCNDNYADCNGDQMDGCETNINTSASNCGGCGVVCNLPNATAGCAAGSCFARSAG